ncbi:BMP family lipoprotein [Pasteuria penetrans]|uniref:BMP family lipoprotein n=1 Tax=Pasteuria penetrans TaxID=86005 RepID=UPI0011F01A95|nr:BMP family ABC transporter substrate-binding protein [Pasteuria penetrans]
MGKRRGWMMGFGVLGLASAMLSLTGCNDGTDKGSTDKTTTSGAATDQKFRLGLALDEGGRNDASFNQTAVETVNGLEKEGKLTPWIADSTKDSEYEMNMEKIAQQKPNLIVAMGFKLEDAVGTMSRKYPDRRFVIIDSDMKKQPPTNVAACLFGDHEGAFLAGLTAGFASKTNKIAFLGGIKSPLMDKGQGGYEAGAKLASAIKGNNVEVTSVYANSFSNENVGYSSAQSLFSGGNDVIYHFAGKVGKGMFRAAKGARGDGREHWVIGTDKDQYAEAPDHILGSVIKKTDVVIKDTINRVGRGDESLFGKVNYYSLKDAAIDFKEDYGSKLDSEKANNLKNILEITKKSIAEGKISIPDTPDAVRTWKVPVDTLEALKKKVGAS